MTKKPKRDEIFGGRFYENSAHGLTEVPPGRPDIWICRRLTDFPRGAAPAGAAVGECAECTAPIAYEADRVARVPASTPLVCMQCAGFEPLPIE
jgi:hypothetical protein